MAISQYARDHGIAGDEFRIFHLLLTALDAEWLDYAAEKAKAQEEARQQR